jgi:HEAT repeat protein
MDSTTQFGGDDMTNVPDIPSLLRSFRSLEPGASDLAIAELVSSNRDFVIESLRNLLKDPDPTMRSDAAEALLRVDAKVGTEAVLILLDDADSAVRWNTCGLLYDFGTERATSRLLELLCKDPEPDVRLIAADALGNLGDLSAVPGLRDAEQFDRGEDHEGRQVSEAAKEAIESILDRFPKT